MLRLRPRLGLDRPKIGYTTLGPDEGYASIRNSHTSNHTLIKKKKKKRRCICMHTSRYACMHSYIHNLFWCTCFASVGTNNLTASADYSSEQ